MKFLKFFYNSLCQMLPSISSYIISLFSTLSSILHPLLYSPSSPLFSTPLYTSPPHLPFRNPQIYSAIGRVQTLQNPSRLHYSSRKLNFSSPTLFPFS